MKKLDVAELLQTAQARTGLSDFGPPDFREALSVLTDGINTEGDVREDRWVAMAEQRFLRPLVNRLWFEKDLADHPQIRDQDLGSPAIIMSLPRTGSTKLHRVLGASQGFQTVQLWSANMFARIPGFDDGGKARRIQETRDYEKWIYEKSPAILTGHPLFTDEPEEDQWLMETTFRQPLLFGMFSSIKYAQWLMHADMNPAFDYLVTQLKYLQWQFGSGHTRPWLLKNPNHLGSEHFLTRRFKKPRFIVTHRDPVKCLPSITSTAMAMRYLYTDRDTSTQLGAGAIQMFQYCANEHMKWRGNNPDVEILDLGFREITENGVSAARKVYDFLDMPFTATAEQGIRQWEQNNPKDKHGKASYSAAAIGSTDEEIREVFSAYTNRFADYLA